LNLSRQYSATEAQGRRIARNADNIPASFYI
jgi:hypothetical protein